MKKIYKSTFRLLRVAAALLVFSLSAGITVAQVSYTFTSAGATGSLGPTPSQVSTSYTNTNLQGSVVCQAGVQIWRVPVSTNYSIQALGASGGGVNGGYGAVMKGDFFLNAGDSILIVVGQPGMDGTDGSTTAGGGSYVMLKTSGSTVVTTSGRTVTPLVIAGGGGGNPGTAHNDCNGIITTTGNAGSGGTAQGNGGVNGNGGQISMVSGNSRGGGGGGMLTDGDHSNTCGTGGLESGRSFLNGSTGGLSTSCSTGYPGGFGGGGGSISSGWRSSGGGGGYSGGGGGQTNSVATNHRGGGGASLNMGINQTNAVATLTGSGRVIIGELCNINIIASGSNTQNPMICSGQSVTLTTNAISNYNWSTGANTSSIVVAPTSTQIYSLTATSVSLCTAVKFITVTVSSGAPTLAINNPSNNICLGRTATLTATGAITYVWTGGVSNGITFTPTTTQSYTVTGTNGCGSTIAVTAITVAPLSVTITASPSVVCQGYTSVLQAISAVNGYTWSNSVTTASITVSPTNTTTYSVTASDGTCAGTSSITISTLVTPTVTASGTSSSVCENATITLTAGGAQSYTWSPVNQQGQVITVTATASTLYQVQGINSVGCISSANWVVIVQLAPLTTAFTNTQVVCKGGQAVLTGGGANSYQWNGGPGTAQYSVTPQASTVYTVTGTAQNGCTRDATVTVAVFNPSITITSSSAGVCPGGNITLNAGVEGAQLYSWNGQTGPATMAFSPTVATVYTVTASSTSTLYSVTCPASNTFQVYVFTAPNITVTANKTSLCKGETPAVLTASGGVSYLWTTNSLTTTSINSSTLSTTTYSVKGTDVNGCSNGATLLITVNTCAGLNAIGGNENGLIVFPNPSNGEFTIQSTQAIELHLISELGQDLKTIILSRENDYKMKLAGIAPGIYFLSDPSGSLVKKKIVIGE